MTSDDQVLAEIIQRLSESTVIPSVAPTGPVQALAAKYGDEDVLLTRQETAEMFRKSVPTLERWARLGIGPMFVRINGRVLYPLTGCRRLLRLGNSGEKAA